MFLFLIKVLNKNKLNKSKKNLFGVDNPSLKN